MCMHETTLKENDREYIEWIKVFDEALLVIALHAIQDLNKNMYKGYYLCIYHKVGDISRCVYMCKNE